MGTNKYLPSDEFIELSEAGLAIANTPEYPSGAYKGYGSYGVEEEGLHLREYLRQLRRHKWLILSLVVIVTTIVTIYAYQIKPWYTASAVLEIGKENSVIVKSGEITLNGDDANTDINTRLLAFSNPKLFQQVAEELNLAQDQEVLASFQKKPMFSFLRTAAAEQTPKGTNPLEDEKQRLALLGGYVQRGIAVEEVRNTRAIKISYTNENPVLAEKIANGVAKIFRESSFNNQTEKFTNSVSWLDTSTRELRAQVQTAEEALDDYSRNNQIFATAGAADGEKGTITASNLTQLNDQYLRAHTIRILKRSQFEQVQAGRLDELPEAFLDPKITALQGQLDKLQGQVAELQVNYGPKNPKLMEVQSQIPVITKQIEVGRKALEAKLKAEYERAVQDEGSLNAALNQAKSAASNENQASIKLNILKQDLDTARSLYTDFLKNTNEAKTRAAEQNNNIKFIQEAQVPGSPIGPNRLNLILAGFLLSLGAGIGLALFLEYLDDTIKSVDDVERYVQLPMLGIVPKIGTGHSKKFLRSSTKQPLIAANGNGSQLGLEVKHNGIQSGLLTVIDNHSIIGEAYRALRTSLLLSTAGTPPKTILVTSGQSGEGKTTTAVNTAISLTQLGAKVVIIDCDLRRPTVHKRLNISAAKGLTNFLAGSCDLNSVIQELDIPNLSVIASGPIPPNPAELLSSKKMKDTLKLLRKEFDHIIIDSPPVMNVTDPIILSTVVDGTIYVIQAGRTRRDIVKRARQELLNVKSKVFGVVLNNVDINKDGHDYYSYYRYSSYESTQADGAAVN